MKKQNHQHFFDDENLVISDQLIEKESHDYKACRFTINDKKVIYRKAKVTPKKIGQFVTFWKRKGKGPIEPFHENDKFDFYIITVSKDTNHGHFIIPKSVLTAKGIISTNLKEGKRGFRVYPPWDEPKSKQAILSQKWQNKYFSNLDNPDRIKLLLE